MAVADREKDIEGINAVYANGEQVPLKLDVS
jgi:hypothetical protein